MKVSAGSAAVVTDVLAFNSFIHLFVFINPQWYMTFGYGTCQ
jgi:hypothetical protein